MSTPTRLAALLLVAGLAAPAMAQDSTSRNSDGGNGFPGDALDAHAAANQRQRYVTTLVPFQTSRGTTFGIAPISKGTKACTAFFNNLISAQAISQTILNDIDASGKTFRQWTGPQRGVNASENILTGTSLVAGPAVSKQFAFAFNEASGGTACTPSDQSQDNIISGLVNFDTAAPAVMYVERIVTAVNKANNTAGTLNTGSLAMGAVDANGNTAYRADNFGSNAAAPGRLANGSYIFRTDAAARSAATTNRITNTGGSDASVTVLNASSTTHNTPSILPADRTGGLPVVLSSNFSANYVFGSNSFTSSTAHRGVSQDHRGGVNYSGRVIFPNTVGTGSIIGKSSSAGSSPADTLLVWGVTTTGAVSGQRSLVVPNSVSDNADPFTATGWQVEGYRSQIAFQGGNGLTTSVVDKNGKAMVAGLLHDRAQWLTIINSNPVFDDANPLNAIVVGRFDPANPSAPVEWSLAAWVNTTFVPDPFDPNSTGKPIYDANDVAIGRLCNFYDIHQDPARNDQYGPCFSVPTFDSAGNIWFVSYVELFGRGPNGESDFDSALIRGIYDADTFSWKLEKVLELGQTFTGADSTVPYQIQFMEIVDGDGRTGSGDPSLSSGTMFAGNANQVGWANNNVSALPNSFPQNLGGIVVSASIVYDVDGNGQFQNPGGTQNPNSVDEAYNVLLYVGNVRPCPADIVPDGQIDLADFFEFLNLFDTNNIGADVTGDGNVDLADFFQFLNSFDVGC